MSFLIAIANTLGTIGRAGAAVAGRGAAAAGRGAAAAGRGLATGGKAVGRNADLAIMAGTGVGFGAMGAPLAAQQVGGLAYDQQTGTQPQPGQQGSGQQGSAQATAPSTGSPWMSLCSCVSVVVLLVFSVAAAVMLM